MKYSKYFFTILYLLQHEKNNRKVKESSIIMQSYIHICEPQNNAEND